MAGSPIIYNLPDGGTQTVDPDTNLVISQTDAKGNVYTAFSRDSNAPYDPKNPGQWVPHHVHVPATATAPESDLSIAYNPDGSETFTDQDGHPEQVYFTDSKASKWIADGWTYTNVDDHVHGAKGNQTVDVYQMPHEPGWTGVVSYKDGKYQGLTIYNGKTPYLRWDADGSSFLFATEIPKLAEAVTKVTHQATNLDSYFTGLQKQFSVIVESWTSPSGGNFAQYLTELNAVIKLSGEVLDQSITAMKATWQNYTSAETTNTQNLTSPTTPLDKALIIQKPTTTAETTNTQNLDKALMIKLS
jgi:hypothetical protein